MSLWVPKSEINRELEWLTQAPQCSPHTPRNHCRAHLQREDGFYGGFRALPAGAIHQRHRSPTKNILEGSLRSLCYSSWFPENISGDGAHGAWSQASPGMRQRDEHRYKLSQNHLRASPLCPGARPGRCEAETRSPSLSWVYWFPVASAQCHAPGWKQLRAGPVAQIPAVSTGYSPGHSDWLGPGDTTQNV